MQLDLFRFSLKTFRLLSFSAELENVAIVDHSRANDVGSHLRVVGGVVDRVPLCVLPLCQQGHVVTSH